MHGDSAAESPFELRPYQKKFVEAFFTTGADRIVGLVSPPGYGKGVAVVEVVRRVLESGAACRVLMLGPRLLSEQHHYMLRKRGIQSFRLDRFSLRTLIDLGGCDSTLPKNGVVVASYEFLRSPDVVEQLRRLQWDLVVADEAQRLGGEATGAAFEAVLRVSNRGLLVSNSLGATMREAANSRIQIIEWTEADAVAFSGQVPGWSRISVRRLEFAPTPEESAFQDRCRRFVDSLVARGVDPAVALRVTRRARTGASIADEVLERWEHRGVPLSRGCDDGDDGAGDEALGVGQGTSRMSFPPGLLQELRAIRGLAAVMKVDSRIEALLGIVRQVGVVVGPQPGVVVLVEGRSTAYYVASALSEYWEEVMVLHAGVELEKALSRMRLHGCAIVVATAAGLREGFDFPGTACAVVYDSEAASLRERHLARFDRFGRRSPLTVFELCATESRSNL
jgi:hypothetical protein